MTAPINAKTFPYQRKWTKAQIEEILERKDKIAEAMTDAVGPVGQLLYVPPDQLHILALHLSLAGCDVVDDLAYIVAEILPDEPGQFEGRHHWHLKSEWSAPPDPDDTKAKAESAADQIRRQLPPEVREQLAALLSQEMANRRAEALINAPQGASQ